MLRRGMVGMRTFKLQRDEDVTGVSGTGAVAEGVQWSDGKVALHWVTGIGSVIIYDDIDHVHQVHGHDRKTRIVWDDEDWGPPDQERADARIPN